MRSKIRIKKKKAPRLRNRYVRNSKLSEYRFLRILRGFADWKTPQEVLEQTHISEKTVRTYFWLFRYKILEAVQIDPDAFGGAGKFTLSGGQLRAQGLEIMELIGDSDAYAAFVQLQMPGRLRKDEDALVMLMEMVVRTFCRLSGKPGDEPSVSPAIRQKGEKLITQGEQLIAALNDEGVSGLTKDHLLQMLLLDKEVYELERKQEETAQFLADFRTYGDPANRLYEDLRQYLIRHPVERS